MKKILHKLVFKIARKLLADSEIRKTLYDIVNHPGDTASPRPKNIWIAIWDEASRDTARYATENMLTKPSYEGRFNLMDKALEAVTLEGLYLEFGCGWKGESINYIASKLRDKTIHGFDSFEGLPHDWFGNLVKGSLSSEGKLPEFNDNVQIHAGWFEEMVPRFVSIHEGDAAFIHIDCDVYSSAKSVFDGIRDRIKPGTVIQFDEYFNYPGWREHEFRAFHEFIADTGLDYDYLGYNRDGFSVAVVIK
jgi:hypothetical protein